MGWYAASGSVCCDIVLLDPLCKRASSLLLLFKLTFKKGSEKLGRFFFSLTSFWKFVCLGTDTKEIVRLRVYVCVSVCVRAYVCVGLCGWVHLRVGVLVCASVCICTSTWVCYCVCMCEYVRERESYRESANAFSYPCTKMQGYSICLLVKTINPMAEHACNST